MARQKAQAGAQTENTIEPAAVRAPPPPDPGLKRTREDDAARGVEAARQSDETPERPRPGPKGPAGAADTAPRDTTTVPQAVRDRFPNIGEKYFFENGDPAFKDLGHKLTTKSENAEIVRSLVEIAQARGWDEITVGGTKEFKRAVWQEATLQKIAVRGYTPTELDEARLVQTMARRAERSRESRAPDEPDAPERAAAPVAEDAGAARRESQSRDGAVAPKAQNKVFRGELIQHGAENYKFDPHEDMSYFVKLKTDNGREIELWGKDLERALHESKSDPKAGDRVEIRYSGKKAVTVSKKERDAQGNVIREYDLSTHRNDWAIETEAFMKERARLAQVVGDPSVDPLDLVKKNPQLAGTVASVRAAELVGRHRFPQDELEQKRFVDTVRKTLARDIRRGEPLPAPALRDRPRAPEPATRAPAAPEVSPLR